MEDNLEDIDNIFRDQEISAVCFVRDYIEIHCEDIIMRIYPDPILEHKGNMLSGEGLSQKIRVLIGDTIKEICRKNNNVLIVMEKGSVLRVPFGKSIDGETLQIHRPGHPSLIV